MRVEVLVGDCSLVGSKQPSLEERRHQVNAGEGVDDVHPCLGLR